MSKFLTHALDTLGFWEVFGTALAQLGEFELAFEEFSKVVEPDVNYAFYAARNRAYVLLGTEDVDQYREVCARLVDEFQDSPVPSNRDIVV